MPHCQTVGESLDISDPPTAEGPVEFWLRRFEDQMRATQRNIMRKGYLEYPKTEQEQIDRGEWLFAYPAQLVIAVDEIFWTALCGEAIRQVGDGVPDATAKFLEYVLAQIEAMVVIVRGDITGQQRTMLGAVITIDVHARDVTRTLARKAIDNLDNFEWSKQLRYYWEEGIDNCTAKQTNTRFVYGYEYLGNSFRLVITPLTDVCYMTLTGAMHMKLGGAPAGPAGTGKTETTKDLAKALAVYCVVFNCSDQIDYKIMGRFHSGLAQQGAWACFDEFNRIDIEVLSVVAQQVMCVQQAMLNNAKTFDFEGLTIPLAWGNDAYGRGFGVYITMNPGYAGRSALPDNLKALYRPVAMMVPDYRLIAEIVLFSFGFGNAFILSNKMAQLYALSSEQLSKVDHYDFGMRAVKSVLVCAGALKRKEPEAWEDMLLIRAMRDSNVPKFLEQDLPLFTGIIGDLFPGVVVPFVDYGALQLAIEDTLVSLDMQPVPSFITKIIQTHETQLVRHGMMLVGEAGSGKTTNCKVLSLALTKLYDDGVEDKDGFYKRVALLILNPKSISAGELFGEFNAMTSEWKDGIVPTLVRQCVDHFNTGSLDRRWIVFDGPVDAIWIENMNTVLDDNKTLCLANSERIKLPSTLHMMFEVQDLAVASPATVSRCGMVYCEQQHIGPLALVQSWGIIHLVKILPNEELCTYLIELVEAHCVQAVAHVREFCVEQGFASTDHNLVQSLLDLLQALLDPDKFTPNPDLAAAKKQILSFFAWSCVWSIGGNVNDVGRPRFSEWIKETLSKDMQGTIFSIYF